VCVCVVVNVKKWEDTVAEDERELDKLKKDENKQMKVAIPRTKKYFSFINFASNHYHTPTLND